MEKKIMLVPLTVFFLLSFCITSATAQKNDLHNKIWSLCVQIAKGYKPQQMQRIAVVDLTTLDDRRCPLGSIIAEKMTTYLKRAENFKLVERTHLKKVMSENNITHSNLFDRENANRLGRLLGARAIVTGTIVDIGTAIDVNARLIDCETSEVLSTASAVIAKNDAVATLFKTCTEEKKAEKQQQGLPKDYKMVIQKLIILDQPEEKPGEEFYIHVWTDRYRYRIGDKITFYCRANRDCYITLIDIGAGGDITILFPNRFVQSNRIEAGRIYKIPSDYYKFSFAIEPPTGIERVKAIASLTPLDVEDYQFTQYTFRSITPLDKTGTKNIGVYLNKLHERAWAEDSLSIFIR